MLEVVAVLCLAGALIILFFLSAIDLREGLLPNELVMGFLALGLVFHFCMLFAFLPMTQMFLGAFIGGSALYLVRTIANMLYKQDALGLGDVKLMGAAGLWLGPYYILIALSVGALMGLLHGLTAAVYIWRKTKEFPDLNRFSLPAGPGFAIGIIITATIEFWELPKLLWP